MQIAARVKQYQGIEYNPFLVVKGMIVRVGVYDAPGDSASLVDSTRNETLPMCVVLSRASGRVPRFRGASPEQRSIYRLGIVLPVHTECTSATLTTALHDVGAKERFTPQGLLEILPDLVESPQNGINRKRKNFFLLSNRTVFSVWASAHGGLAVRTESFAKACASMTDRDVVFTPVS